MHWLVEFWNLIQLEWRISMNYDPNLFRNFTQAKKAQREPLVQLDKEIKRIKAKVKLDSRLAEIKERLDSK
jgi:hypothetical protein